MSVEPLEIERAYAYLDEETRIIRIKYNGNLDGQTSTQVYTWLNGVVQALGIEAIAGEIFDFREVREFLPDNIMEARKKSRGMNLRNDTSSMPVVMIVKDFYQEEILRGPMQNLPENPRKRIVRTEEEALTFIQEWNKTRA